MSLTGAEMGLVAPSCWKIAVFMAHSTRKAATKLSMIVVMTSCAPVLALR